MHNRKKYHGLSLIHILRGEKTAFGYCVLPNRFIFIEYETKIEPMLREMMDYPNIDAASPLQFLFKFMEYLLEDDMIFLQGYEDNLAVSYTHLHGIPEILTILSMAMKIHMHGTMAKKRQDSTTR